MPGPSLPKAKVISLNTQAKGLPAKIAAALFASALVESI